MHACSFSARIRGLFESLSISRIRPDAPPGAHIMHFLVPQSDSIESHPVFLHLDAGFAKSLLSLLFETSLATEPEAGILERRAQNGGRDLRNQARKRNTTIPKQTDKTVCSLNPWRKLLESAPSRPWGLHLFQIAAQPPPNCFESHGMSLFSPVLCLSAVLTKSP